MLINRRNLITGLISFVAAPAIVRTGSLMPVKRYDDFDPQSAFNELINRINKCVPSGLTIDVPYNLFWINSAREIIVVPIKENSLYLDSLNDHS